MMGTRSAGCAVTDQPTGHPVPEHARCECPPDIKGRHFLECVQRRDRARVEKAERDVAVMRAALEEIVASTRKSYVQTVAQHALERCSTKVAP
jgi:hypothetical protein